MRRPARILSIVLAMIALGGCSMFGGGLQGSPNIDVRYLLPPDVVVALDSPRPPPQTGAKLASAPGALQPESGPAPQPVTDTELSDCRGAYAANAVEATRNNCVKALMAMIDIRYGEFRDGLVKLVDDSDLAADVAILGLGSATGLVPGKTTKSILGAISGGIGGTKAAINSDVLYNTSIVIIINQMDSDRANQRCLILNGLKNNVPINQLPAPTAVAITSMTTTVKVANGKPAATTKVAGPTSVTASPPPTYSMYDASSDLIQYYEAGTFTHALQALEAKTGSQATASKQQAANLKAGNTADNSVTQPAAAPAPNCSS